MGAARQSHVLQRVCGPDRSGHGSPNPPESPRPAAPGAGRAAHFRVLQDLGRLPARAPRRSGDDRGRDVASRGLRPARSKPRVRSHGRGTRRAGASGSGQWRVPEAPPRPPPGPTSCPRVPGPGSRGAPCGGAPRECADAPPGPGALGRRRRLGGAGTTFRRPRPAPVLARRIAPRGRRRQDTAAPARLIRGPCAAPF